MRKLKSIEEIYEEVRDCSLVVTNDAPLATALNRLCDRPLIGPFAVTPRQIAVSCAVDVMGSPVWSELRIVQTICDENPELEFSYVHGEVQRIREIRRYTRDVEKHLFTASSKKVYRSWKAIPSVETVMDRFEPEMHYYPRIKGKLAVIGVEMFDDLDKRMTPYHVDYLDIDMFGSEKCFLPDIYQIGNDRQVAENAIALIGEGDPNDFAIVMNTSSPIVDSVKSALYRKGMPFINSLMVRDLDQIRNYLEFLHLSLSYETLRVKHVREMLSSLDVHVKSNMDEHLFDKILLDKDSEKLREVMRDIRQYTFGELISMVFKDHSIHRTVKMVIDDLHLTDENVSTRLVERLDYAVDNISDLHHNEQLTDNERKGVLLVDSRRSVFIDRPIVIYLGLGDDWGLDLAGKKYIDHVEYETERVATRTEALLQQGVGRYYLVNTSRGGKDARPSMLFSEFFDVRSGGDFLEFEDMLEDGKTTRKERWSDEKSKGGIESESILLEPGPYEVPFSQSGFAAYYKCPYSFQFRSTLGSSDADYFEFGNLIHQFAELYFSHPDKANDEFENLVERTVQRFSGISSPALGKIDSGRIRCAMTNVKRYIDRLGYTGDRKLTSVDNYDNFFYDILQLTEKSSLCEDDLYSNEHMIHGKMDLNAGVVVDYKTSKKMKTTAEIMDGMILGGKDIDLQAIFYLALAYEKWSGNEMQFMFTMGHDTQQSDEGFDVMNNVHRVV
ncbi:MAG: PD-(D/E)XK nuclease family protein, partial [Candidatus Methanomethylophilaceae archaeon]|nr:PD-(D/E)XK nuclease family protein [Candidatus Methanomethylophilaceae archaeon]